MSFPIERLPPELIPIICDHVVVADLKNLRLANKFVFYRPATRECFRTLLLYPAVSSHERSNQVTQHQTLSKHVKSFVYSGRMLYYGITIGSRYEDWYESVPPDLIKYRDRMSPVELREAFKQYREFSEDQGQILKSTNEVDSLVSVLKSLENLEQVTLDTSYYSCMQDQIESSTLMSFSSYGGWKRHVKQALRLFKVLLALAPANLNSIKLERLQIAQLTRYDQDLGTENLLLDPGSILPNVTKFTIGLSSRYGWLDELSRRRPSDIKWYILDKNVSLITSGTPNVKHLVLDIHHSSNTYAASAHASQSLLDAANWPKLYRLDLHSVILTQEHFHECLEKRAGTLRQLKLDKVRLWNGSSLPMPTKNGPSQWITLFHFMHRVLSLNSFRLVDRLYEQSRSFPESEWQLNEGRDEDLSMESKSSSSLGMADRIELYVARQGSNPFTVVGWNSDQDDTWKLSTAADVEPELLKGEDDVDDGLI